MARTAVLGAGAMGTACAWLAAQRHGAGVSLWARNADYATAIAQTRCNQRLLPQVRLPDDVLVTSDAAVALASAEVVLVCVPMRGLRQACQQLQPLIPSTAVLVSTIKGIENSTLQRPSSLLRQFFPEQPIVALGGPCHAEELVQRKPTTIVAAAEDQSAAERIQQRLATEFLRVYANSDVLGVELGGALKNVIAIAAGICDGLGFGDNARAAVITRGLSEMVRFGALLGAEPATFFGLAGIGDLVATCTSRHSRNRYVGEQLGRGLTLQQIEQSMQAVAEGVLTARSVQQLAAERQIEMPIVDQVCAVLFAAKPPLEAAVDLMNRPPKAENRA
ncbi:MAG TPA: glycerol-3-phosphate dehydrogenase [Planctomycetaceae bacterium]|nr:glycerol-3-phosphate dehydrogenase [Planctomycetaceae bacterium]